MPSHEEESDEFSDSDPWGSDFETEDDVTDAGSIRTRDLNDEEEEDPYDSVEISPMRERKRPVIINITGLLVFVIPTNNYFIFEDPSIVAKQTQ